MSGRIVFLLEEPSMKHLLETLLPRLFPGWVPGLNFLCIQHEGKSDLRKSIPRKIRAWQAPEDRFIVVHDQDSAECRSLKADLQTLCTDTSKAACLVRIVCRELEAWYLGDLEALAEEYADSSLLHVRTRKKFNDPDSCDQPSRWLEKHVNGFQKISAAARMGRRLHPGSNRSRSFQVFIEGVRRLQTEMV